MPALTARLTPLVKRVAGAVKAGQPGADGLRAAAEAAYGALQAGDLAAAGQGADNLERLLGGPAAATGGTSAFPSPAGPAALTKDLASLVKRIAPAVAADPACQATLPGLAMKAHACLKSGDAAGAAAGIEALRQALNAPAATGGVPGPGQAGPPPGGPAASPGADAPSPGRNLLADAMMQGVDQAQAARQADGRPEGVQVAQMRGAITHGVAASLPPAAGLGQGRSTGAPPSLSQNIAKRFERMQRRNRATLDEVGRGSPGLAAARVLGLEPYPPEVEDGYPPVPVRAPQTDAAPSAAPASPNPTGARVGTGPLRLPEATPAGPAAVASTDGAGTTQVRAGGAAALTALDPSWAGALGRPGPAAAPLAPTPEGFDARPGAGRPAVVGTPLPNRQVVPSHTGSPPVTVNPGDLREGFPALQPQGPTILTLWGDGAPETVHQGQQDKHVPNTNNHIPGRSVLTGDAQKLLDTYSGKGQPVGKPLRGQPGFREQFDTGNQIIGTFNDSRTGTSVSTTRGTIHYSKDGAHIVPARP